MRKYSNELKVGIMVIVFAVAAFFILYEFMGEKKEEGETFVIQFNSAGGISQGDSVRYAGVEIGKVKSIRIREAELWDWNEKKERFVPRTDEHGNRVKGDAVFVTILLTNEEAFESRLPIFTENTEVTIATSFMNEHWIEIKPHPGQPLSKGDVLKGHAPITIEEFLTKGEQTIEKITEAAESVNEIIGDPQLRQDIKLSLNNFKDITGNLKDVSRTTKERINRISDRVEQLTENANRVINNVDRQVTMAGGNVRNFTRSLDRIARTNEGDIRSVVKSLKATSRSLHNTIKTVETLVTKKQFSEDILATLRNVRNASEEVEGIASDIRAITSDGQVREDLKVALHEARSAATSADKLIKSVNRTLGIEDSGKKKEDEYSQVKARQGSGNNSDDDLMGNPDEDLEFGDEKREKKGKEKKSSYDDNETSKIDMGRFIVADLEVEYDDVREETVPNANVIILPRNSSSYVLGLDSMGFDNLVNLQYRKNFNSIKPRIGLIRSKLGAGTDLDIGKVGSIFVDAYDLRNWQVDLTGRLMISRGFYFHGGVRDLFDEKRAVFGVGKRF